MRRRVARSDERGRLVEDACFAVTFADFQVDGPERAERAMTALTDAEREFVMDYAARRITEQGCLIELIERRFGRYT